MKMNKTKKILSLLLVLSVFNAEAETKSNKFIVGGAISLALGSSILAIQKFLVKGVSQKNLNELKNALTQLAKAPSNNKEIYQGFVNVAELKCQKDMGPFYMFGNFNVRSFKTIFALLLVLVGLVLVFYGYQTSKEEKNN